MTSSPSPSSSCENFFQFKLIFLTKIKKNFLFCFDWRHLLADHSRHLCPLIYSLEWIWLEKKFSNYETIFGYFLTIDKCILVSDKNGKVRLFKWLLIFCSLNSNTLVYSWFTDTKLHVHVAIDGFALFVYIQQDYSCGQSYKHSTIVN